MPTADEVVVEFEARVSKYEADIKRATRTFASATDIQQTRMKQLERTVRQSSGNISSSLKGVAASFATYFTGRELAALADNFTRLQNQLKVAGLEGDNLKAVQDRLFASAQRYGVEINALAELYGKAAQAGADLGASQEDLLKLTDATSQALLISGTSATQAQGAILGLSQALASGTVRAEEFNQMNEGGLRSLLQAAAASERFGGSVGKLRQAVVDGTVSSQEFYRSILANSELLEKQASKATLTLSAGVTALTNALTVYFGEADKANGVSAALGEALGLIADNLDILIPAIIALSVALGTGFVVNAVRAQVAAAGAATAFGGMAIAARGAGAAMLGAFGGPVGLIITGLALGIGYLATEMKTAEAAAADLARETDNLTTQNDQLADRLKDAGVAVGALGSYADRSAEKMRSLSGAMELTIGVAFRLVQQLNQLGVMEDLAKLGDIAQQRQAATNPNVARGPMELGQWIRNQVDPDNNAKLIRELDRQAEEITRRAELRRLAVANGINPDGPSGGPGVSAGVSDKAKTKSGGASGPTVAEIEQRFEKELISITQQSLSSMEQIATTADERAELQGRALEWARRQSVEEIQNDEHYTDLQKQELIAATERLADHQRAAIEFERRVQIEREAADMADTRFRNEQDVLQLSYDMAKTERERRAIALQILDAEIAYQRAKLEAVLASETAAEAEKQRAQLLLEGLNAAAPGRRSQLASQHQGALGRWLEGNSDPDARIEEAVVRKMEAVNSAIVDGITESLGIEDSFIKDLFSIFLDEVIFKPLAEALSSAGGEGGWAGTLLSAATTLFGGGRAIGGPVKRGTAYLVGENGPEMFSPQQAGVIIPNGRLRGGGNTTVVSSPQFDLRGSVVLEDLYADMERISRANAAVAGRTAYKQARRDVPSRMQEHQRYGK